jgi:hypothetical protein
MELSQSLRYAKTRRVTGRRSITPMRSKHRKTIPKTRHHKVEKRDNVQLRKHTGSQYDGRREGADKDEHSQDKKRERNQDCDHESERKDEEKHAQVEPLRNTENSEESVHPGPLQTMSEVSEQTAVHEETDKTEIESEELSPLE